MADLTPMSGHLTNPFPGVALEHNAPPIGTPEVAENSKVGGPRENLVGPARVYSSVGLKS